MKIMRVRKNFLFDKEIVEKVQKIVNERHKNLTEAISLYFKALVKHPEILDEIEKVAQKRTGKFIGLLDGKVGDESWREMKKSYYDDTGRFE